MSDVQGLRTRMEAVLDSLRNGDLSAEPFVADLDAEAKKATTTDPGQIQNLLWCKKFKRTAEVLVKEARTRVPREAVRRPKAAQTVSDEEEARVRGIVVRARAVFRQFQGRPPKDSFEAMEWVIEQLEGALGFEPTEGEATEEDSRAAEPFLRGNLN